jgi:hypothetical protein
MRDSIHIGVEVAMKSWMQAFGIALLVGWGLAVFVFSLLFVFSHFGEAWANVLLVLYALVCLACFIKWIGLPF